MLQNLLRRLLMGEHEKRRYSSQLFDGTKRAPSRGVLRAVGFTDADFKKPQVGAASTWSSVTPCNSACCWPQTTLTIR
jgi:dihydroxy-acid dehydratase